MNNREERANTALYQEGYRSGFKDGRQSLLPVIDETVKTLKAIHSNIDQLMGDSDFDTEQLLANDPVGVVANILMETINKLQSVRAEIEGT